MISHVRGYFFCLKVVLVSIIDCFWTQNDLKHSLKHGAFRDYGFSETSSSVTNTDTLSHRSAACWSARGIVWYTAWPTSSRLAECCWTVWVCLVFGKPTFGKVVDGGFGVSIGQKTTMPSITVKVMHTNMVDHGLVVAECSMKWNNCSKLQLFSNIWVSSVRSTPNSLEVTAILVFVTWRSKSLVLNYVALLDHSVPVIIVLIY